MIQKVERLISEINRIHKEYSIDYFETGQIQKVNLKHTFSKVPTSAILAYRLNLHESINDYLMKADLQDIAYVYRVKTSESILDKIDRFSERTEGYPVNSILNDIFGARVILRSEEISQVMERLDDWKDTFGLKNWYLRDKEGYIGIHVYFKNKSNFYYPWELQIWDAKDVDGNIQSHRLYKRGFVNPKL
ncbi:MULTISPECIES: GTP pyrophosphokinase [unclassified Streptococcus]|uniref:GTP pyrophosphokinase n=1 Tax=unclassified Streptococcus TaxID=2608887 RepID=UPI0018AB9FE0|nr:MULTISPECIES: GTP pyrophosphokinase [unclassified Streptococcus]MBF8970521.1 GTP pyrophosphokinase [Streptococcus sp. NLN76]MBG9368029.1 GTP pyrophosphokinase [Streptococcus sp. NLN64]